MIRGVLTPRDGCPGLFFHNRVIDFIGTLGFAKEFGSLSLYDEIRDVLVIPQIENLEYAFIWLEPFQHSLVIFQNDCQPALGIGLKLLDWANALAESGEQHATD